MDRLTVIDIFCGAGGFSEGFRQTDFEIKWGVDKWESAIKTFNHNFGLQCPVKDVLIYKDSIKEIESLPDTDVIIGSPPCVTFSSSNISGKADKTSGITLTQIFLKIVAIKKWQPNSKLKAWFMENVPSSIKHLALEYTFEDLGLGEWATANKIGRTKVAIKLEGNQKIINSADYGSPQSRERVIAGEIIKRNKLVIPQPSHSNKKEDKLLSWVPIKEVKGKLPKPNCRDSSRKIVDPNYPSIKINLNTLTDHFYDTGLFECEWRQSKFLKVNHPYMGRMSFPENNNKPSRTITATKIGTSREAIIYRSEIDRKKNGEYRTPTVREAACLMSFPITYQFLGGETTKWRLVGNAVCPSVARMLANQVRIEYDLSPVINPIFQLESNFREVNNLNTFSEKRFKKPPKRNKGSRFRRHPFKDGNMTVTLSNYDIDKNEKTVSKWITSVQYGNGEGFPTYNYPNEYYKKIEPLIEKSKNGKKFLEIINNGFTEKISDKITLQEMYEHQKSRNGLLEPTELIEKVRSIINSLGVDQEEFIQNGQRVFINKELVPVKQLFALYAINKIASLSNQK